MGELINLAERRELRRRSRATPRSLPVRAEFFYDLACPFTYLVAERVERAYDDVVWTPASATALRRGSPVAGETALAGARAAAQERAAALRLPLVWPETWPRDVPAAMRVASYAAERGRGAAFALAAGRLAFCGGFDLDDPDSLAEAAAAAGLDLEESLGAAADRRRDGASEAAARRLLAVGADQLPALRVGRSLFWGDSQVAEAVATARLSAAACR
jgi:2-hydroxychromene-2-carboxylate isomerase